MKYFLSLYLRLRVVCQHAKCGRANNWHGVVNCPAIVANFMDNYSVAHETSFNLRPLKPVGLPTNPTGRELGLRPS